MLVKILSSKNRFMLLFILAISIRMLPAQTTGYCSTTDDTLHYKIFGEGPPLLFLNGGPGLATDGYEGIAEQLKSKRKVILFDQRGTGKSKINEVTAKTITSAKMVEDIEALRHHLKIESWDVIGQSFGGVYAMYYANSYPTSINKLILTSTLAPRKDEFKDFKYVNFFKGKFFKSEREVDSVYTRAIKEAQQKLRTLQQWESLERKKMNKLLVNLENYEGEV